MRRPKPLAAVPEPRRPVDDSTVVAATRALRARAEAQFVWARIDEAELVEAEVENTSKACLDEARQYFHSLAAYEPRTVRGATAMLSVALDVLVHRLLEPDLVLAEGPVIEIIRNVRNALQTVDPDTPLVIETGEPEGDAAAD